MLDDLVNAAKLLASLGLSPGSTGNLSQRIGKTIWVSASGTSFSTITSHDFIPFQNGVWGEGRATKEAPLHLEMYRRNPSAEVVIHLHSPEAAAVSCLPQWNDHCAIPPLSPYFVMRVGNLPMVAYHAPGSVELAHEVANLTTPFDCALLQNHGQIASGEAVDQVVDRCIEIENSSRLRLLLEGKHPRLLTSDEAEALARENRRPWLENDWRVSSDQR